MGRKRNPYLPLYTRDIMSSPRCRALSSQAAGVYLFLLCRLNEPPQPGAFRLSDWEAHPTWRRSLTQQCLAEADKYRRLQYFARYLSKNDLPWDKKEVLDGLQELYHMGIVVVEGDMLVQPRMYKDNGFELPDLDADGDPEGTILDDDASGSMAVKDDEEFSENKGAEKGAVLSTKKCTQKVREKVHVSHAGACSNELEIENNKNNNKGNIGGVGEKRTAQPSDDGKIVTIDGKPVGDTDNGGPTFSEFWDAYDKKVNMIEAQAYWDVLSNKDHEAIMAYIPQYKVAQPRKQFRKNPVTFLRNRAWQDEIIREQEPISNNDNGADQTNSRRTTAGGGRNQEQEAAALREQTVRLIERNRAQRAAAQADGTDTGDDPF